MAEKKVTITEKQYDEFLKMFQERFDDQNKTLTEIKTGLAERRHLDAKVLKHEEYFNGNGKTGLLAIRDKVTSWETKMNAIVIAISADLIWRVFQFVVK